MLLLSYLGELAGIMYKVILNAIKRHVVYGTEDVACKAPRSTFINMGKNVYMCIYMCVCIHTCSGYDTQSYIKVRCFWQDAYTGPVYESMHCVQGVCGTCTCVLGTKAAMKPHMATEARVTRVAQLHWALLNINFQSLSIHKSFTVAKFFTIFTLSHVSPDSHDPQLKKL